MKIGVRLTREAFADILGRAMDKEFKERKLVVGKDAAAWLNIAFSLPSAREDRIREYYEARPYLDREMDETIRSLKKNIGLAKRAAWDSETECCEYDHDEIRLCILEGRVYRLLFRLGLLLDNLDNT